MAWAVLGLILMTVLSGMVQSFECPRLSTQSLIPDPDDCRKYYHCLPDRRLFPMQCPNGLVFDPRQKVCIWDSNARSCAPSYELEPIKPWQPKERTTNAIDNNADRPMGTNSHTNNSKGRNSNWSQHNKTQKPNQNQNRNQKNKRKLPTTRKPRNDWRRRTTQRKAIPTTSTARPRTSTTTTTTTASTTTTAAAVMTTEILKEGSEFETMDRTATRSGRDNLVQSLLVTLGFDVDADEDKTAETSDDTAPVNDKIHDVMLSGEGTLGPTGTEADENVQQTTDEHHTSQIYTQGRKPHSVYKRSPEDNMVWDNIQCPSGYAYIPDPSDCGTFYHCYNWQPMKKKCPPGLFFDHKMYVCNWPHNVNCIEGYRAKTLFRFNDMWSPREKTSRPTASTRTTRPPQKSPRRSWKKSTSTRKPVPTDKPVPSRKTIPTRKYIPSRKYAPTRKPVSSIKFVPTQKPVSTRKSVTSTKLTPFTPTTKIPRPTKSFTTELNSSTTVSASTSPLLSRSSQQLSEYKTTLKYPARVSFLTAVEDATQDDLMTKTLSMSTSPTSTVFSSIPDIFSSMTERVSSNSQNVSRHQRTSRENSPLVIQKTRPTAHSSKLTSPMQSSHVHISNKNFNSNGLLYQFRPVERPTERSQSQLKDFALNKPTAHYPTLNHFSFNSNNAIIPEPYASAMKTKDNHQKKDKDNTKPSETTTTSSPVQVNGKMTFSLKNESQMQTTKTISKMQSTNLLNSTKGPTSMATDVNVKLNVTDTVPTMKVDTSSTTKPDNINYSPTYPTSRITANQTSTASPNETMSSSAPPTRSQTVINDVSSTETTFINDTVSKLSTQTTASTKTMKIWTTPIAFTTARIPFYARRNQPSQTASWVDQGRRNMRGNRLRSHTHDTQKWTQGKFRFSQPSAASSAFRAPSALHLNKPIMAIQPNIGEDVSVEKFMIRLLNDAMKSKHVVSRDTSANRKKDNEKMILVKDKTIRQQTDTNASNEVVENNRVKTSQPLLIAKAGRKEDFTTTKNVEDLRVSGKVVTDMTASLSTIGGVQNEKLKVEELTAIRTGTSSNVEDVENLVIAEVQLVDKRLPKEAPQYELDYSGDLDSDWNIPQIQPFSALADHDKPGNSPNLKSLTDTETALKTQVNKLHEKRTEFSGDNNHDKKMSTEKLETSNATVSPSLNTTESKPSELIQKTTDVIEGNTQSKMMEGRGQVLPNCTSVNCSIHAHEGLNDAVSPPQQNVTDTARVTNTGIAPSTNTTGMERSIPEAKVTEVDTIRPNNKPTDNDNKINSHGNSSAEYPKTGSEFQVKNKKWGELEDPPSRQIKMISHKLHTKTVLNDASSVQKVDRKQDNSNDTIRYGHSESSRNGTKVENIISASSNASHSFTTVTSASQNSHYDKHGKQGHGQHNATTGSSALENALPTEAVTKLSEYLLVQKTDSSVFSTSSVSDTDSKMPVVRPEEGINSTISNHYKMLPNETIISTVNGSLEVTTSEQNDTRTVIFTLIVSADSEGNNTFDNLNKTILSVHTSIINDTSENKTEGLAMQETVPNANITLNSSVNNTRISTTNLIVSHGVNEGSEQIPVVYLSKETKLKSNSTMRGTDGDDRHDNDTHQGDISEEPTILDTVTDRSASTDRPGHSRTDHTTSLDLTDYQHNTSTISNSTREPNETTTTPEENRTISLESLNLTSVNMTDTTGSSFNSSQNTTTSVIPGTVLMVKPQTDQLAERNQTDSAPPKLTPKRQNDSFTIKPSAIVNMTDHPVTTDSTLDESIPVASSDEQKDLLISDKDTDEVEIEVHTTTATTATRRSFVSLADLITWYLKHWRNYSKWRQDQTATPVTASF